MIRAGLLVVLAFGLVACKSSSESRVYGEEQDELIEVSGRVTVTGSAPYVRLVIITGDEHYELVGDLAEELWDLQQREVTVRGRIIRQAMDRPGAPARFMVHEYTLG